MALSVHHGLTYRLMNAATFTCADLYYGYTTPGTAVNGWHTYLDLAPGNHQTWRLDATGLNNGLFRIVNEPAHTVWELQGGSNVDGTLIVDQNNAANNLNQIWNITQVNGPSSIGLFSIQNQASGTYAELKGGNASDNVPIVGMNHPNGVNANSKWMFIPLDLYYV